MLTRHQAIYFDKTIKIENVKHTISSPREYDFQNLLNDIGYREGIDYIHQFACAQEETGKLYIADFAFPEEKIIIELDGSNHKHKKQIKMDADRDEVFHANGYTVIRIKTPLDEYHGIYWKYLIKENIDLIREKLYGKQEPELD